MTHYFLWILLFAFGGCTSIVPLPEVSILGPASQNDAEQLVQSPPPLKFLPLEIPDPEPVDWLPQPGTLTPFGQKMNAAWVEAVQMSRLGDGKGALKKLREAEANDPTPGAAWEIGMYRLRVLLQMGRAADALDLVDEVVKKEQLFLGNALIAPAFRGEILVWMGKFEEARRQVTPILISLSDWEFPVEYPLPPENMSQLIAYSTSKLQSMTAFSSSLVLENRIQESLPWLEATELEYQRLEYVAQHPLYSLFFVRSPESIYGRSLNLAFFGAAKLELAKNTKSIPKELNQATKGFQAIGYRYGELLVEAFKARSLLNANRLKQAEKQALSALDLAEKLEAFDLIWRIAALLGEAQAGQKKMESAEASYRAAQLALEQASGTLSSDSARTRFGIGKSYIDQFLIDLDWQQKNPSQLFEDLERGRARAFVDLMTERLTVMDSLPEIQELQKIDQDIVRSRLLKSISQDHSSERKRPSQSMETLVSRRATILENLEEDYPDWVQAFSITTFDLSEIQEKLKPGEKMIYVLPGPSDQPIRLFNIESKKISFTSLNWSDSELKEILQEFRDSVGIPEEEEDITSVLNEMMDDPLWSAEKRIYVVPSGTFHFMPWGLLEEMAPVVILPTGGWLLRKSQKVESLSPPVIIGNPQFGGKMEPLPAAELESRDVAKLFGTSPLLHEEATLEALQTQVGKGTSILHLATHGVYNDLDPLRSAFILTESGKARAVTAADLLMDPLPAQLVVLSACETGLGKTLAGEDLQGLTRSFYLGGSLAVLSSLWPVEDEGARQFMNEFYRQFQNTKRFDQAWLAARNSLRNSGASPSVYGAFVLSGSAGI